MPVRTKIQEPKCRCFNLYTKKCKRSENDNKRNHPVISLRLRSMQYYVQ